MLVGLNGVVDAATLMPKVKFPNTGSGVFHPETVADRILPLNYKYAIAGQGIGELIWDSESARFFSFNGVVRSYKPKSLELENTLVLDADLAHERHLELRKPVLVGNPDAGAFALNYGDRALLFTNKWSKISLPDQDVSPTNNVCYDAGPNGLLLETHSGNHSLLCLDADSGGIKWKADSSGWSKWVGNLVVSVDMRTVEGKDCWMAVLDGGTGRKLGSVLIPPKYIKPSVLIGDLLILETKAREFGAYRISQS